MSQKLVSRKQLSQSSGLTVDEIRNNEKRLGLDKCKVSINERNIRYRQIEAEQSLKDHGFYA